MHLIFLKLVETLARALFVFTVVYSLQIEESGQFGILCTLVGLFAFAFGYERHIDIQRKFSAESNQNFDRAIINASYMYCCNYIVIGPVFFIFALFFIKLSYFLATLSVVIVICEQIGNQAYHLALVNIRYRKLIRLVALKNVVNFAAVIYILFENPSSLTLDYVLEAWAISSFMFTILIIVSWWRFKSISMAEKKSFFFRIFYQYKASFTHFLIGLLAIVSLQLDRIMVSSLLEFADVGIYFRHILLVSFIYQFFNIASFNRVLPTIFSNSKHESSKILRRRLKVEYKKVFLFVLLVYWMFLLLYYSPLLFVFDKYQIQIELLAVLFMSFLIRAAADFNGLIYNAKGKEKSLLIFQFIALCVGIISFIILTTHIGITGAVIAGTFGSSTYLILTMRNFKFIESGTQ